MKYDMIVQHALVFNSFTKQFIVQDVAIKDGIFQHIADSIHADAQTMLDAKGCSMIPGLVDIHMHIESSMSIPSRFSDSVLPHGVTTVVADPHEIANVLGVEGILSFLSNETPLDIFYGIPSSVPSTNDRLETTGGKIGVKEVAELLQHQRIVCLGEVMNFHDVCYEPESISAKIIQTCKEVRPDLPIEGHCPKISGEELDAFLAAGVSADHTHQTKKSVLEKISRGMFLEIQRKSMSQDVIDTLIANEFYEYFAFVTDDVMADHLKEGHLNLLVKKAIDMGMSPENAIYCATFTPARRMHLEDRGAIVPGRIADFILLSDLSAFTIQKVYKKGMLCSQLASASAPEFPAHFYHSLQCRKAEIADFQIPLKGTYARCNIMEIEPHSTFTRHVQEDVAIKDGYLHWQGKYALLCVMERYGKHGGIAYGLVKHALTGIGAIATSWAHDHHNVLLLGTCEEDLLLAQHTLLDMQGGYVVVQNHRVVATAQLEIGGIVSAKPIAELGSELREVRKAMEALGYHHDNAIMSCSTLSLPVSPQLKITDRGLIDTKTQKILPLVEGVR